MWKALDTVLILWLLGKWGVTVWLISVAILITMVAIAKHTQWCQHCNMYRAGKAGGQCPICQGLLRSDRC
jgi:hypothetical protein